MVKLLDAQGRTVSHEAIYRWIYVMPSGDLAREGMRTVIIDSARE